MDKEDLSNNLDRINNWINNADTKASILIAVIFLIIGFVFEKKDEYFSFCRAVSDPYLKGLLLLALLALLFLLLASLFHAFLIILPRLKNGNEAVSSSFFLHIGQQKQKDYLSGIKKLTKKDLTDDLSSQVYVNSVIATKKFNYLKMLTWELAIGLVLFLGLQILVVIWG